MKNVLSLEAFAEFCESKPKDEVYRYSDWKNCACGQYAKSLGLDFIEIWRQGTFNNEWMDSFWGKANAIACPVRFCEITTFGELAVKVRNHIDDSHSWN